MKSRKKELEIIQEISYRFCALTSESKTVKKTEKKEENEGRTRSDELEKAMAWRAFV